MLGLSVLVEIMNNPRYHNATESTTLESLFTEDAPDVANGESIVSQGKSKPCLVLATVKDTQGNAIKGRKRDRSNRSL